MTRKKIEDETAKLCIFRHELLNSEEFSEDHSERQKLHNKVIHYIHPTIWGYLVSVSEDVREAEREREKPFQKKFYIQRFSYLTVQVAELEDLVEKKLHDELHNQMRIRFEISTSEREGGE